MSEIINKDGVDIEVFTADELEAQKQAAIEDYRANNPDKTEELDALQSELKAANEKLAKANKYDQDFSALRKQKDAAEKKVEEILKGVDEKIGTVKKEVLEGVMQDHYSETLKALAGDDEELLKKIEFNYKRLGDPAATKEEVSKKLRDAWTLASGRPQTDALNSSVISSGGVGRLNINSTGKKFTPEEQALGAKFGLSSEDFQKYGR